MIPLFVTHLLMGISAYLLIGAIVMLVINELLYGIVTRKEFLSGMMLWPLLIVAGCSSLVDAYWKRGKIR